MEFMFLGMTLKFSFFQYEMIFVTHFSQKTGPFGISVHKWGYAHTHTLDVVVVGALCHSTFVGCSFTCVVV